MRALPLLIAAFVVAGCGSAMTAEQPAAEADTARIAVSWGDEPSTGVFDLRAGTGVVEGTIITVDAVYDPAPFHATGARRKRWIMNPEVSPDPFLLAPIAERADQLIALLETAERGEPVGKGMERGEAVTFYAATVRMDQFIATQSRARQAELQEVYSDWQGVVFQLAVDSEGRFRRADFDFWYDDVLTIELFDYGVPVDARAPDPSTVLTWEEYGKLLRAECERAKKEGRENEVSHCASCGAGEGEA